MKSRTLPLLRLAILAAAILLALLVAALSAKPVHALTTVQAQRAQVDCTDSVYDGAGLFVNVVAVQDEVKQVEKDVPGMVVKVRTIGNYKSENVPDFDGYVQMMTSICPTWAGTSTSQVAPNFVVLLFDYWDRQARYVIGSDWSSTLTHDKMQGIMDTIVPTLQPVHNFPNKGWDDAMTSVLDQIDSTMVGAQFLAAYGGWIIGIVVVVVILIIIGLIYLVARYGGTSGPGSGPGYRQTNFFVMNQSTTSSTPTYTPPPSSTSGGVNF